MFKWRTTATIGLSLQQTGIGFVEFNPKTSQVARSGTLAFSEEVLSDDRIIDEIKLVELLRPWIQEHKLKGRNVHLSIPTSQAVIRKIQVPALTGKALDQQIQLNIQVSQHLPFDNPIFDYEVMEPDKGNEQLDVLVYAAPRDLIQSYVAILKMIGVKVISVDLPGLALLRLAEQMSPQEGNFMILSMTPEHVEMFIYHRSMLEFMRSLPMRDSMEGMREEWLYSEIQTELTRMINFFEFSMHDGTERITKVLLTGDVARLSPFIDYVKDTILNLEWEVMNPGGLIGNAGEPKPGCEVALGLALREGPKHEKH